MSNESFGAAGAIVGLVFFLIYIAVIVFEIVALWKVYAKAGKPGWACLIPIYDIIVLLDIAKCPIWYIILFFIPVVNVVATVMVSIKFAQVFGKGIGMALLIIFLPVVAIPVLAFGNAKYQG